MKRLRERIARLLEEAEAAGALDEAERAVREFLATRGRALAPAPDPGGGGARKGSRPPEEADSRGRYGIIGRGPAMREVFDLLEKILPSSYPVLVLGESGTGKELVARALHEHGPRKSKPFVSENCAAIPETLLESELFGHRRGSFTGAVADRKGHFVVANTGTIFLDEIGDMSPSMQVKMLRVLQDGEVRPVGGTESFHVDVRVIAATNRDLRDLVRQQRFREDLYFRLAVLEIRLPPLRDRREDIPLLAEHFLGRASEESRRPVAVTPEAMKRLVAYDWPGNVRELENEIRRGAALGDGAIRPEDLSPAIAEGTK